MKGDPFIQERRGNVSRFLLGEDGVLTIETSGPRLTSSITIPLADLEETPRHFADDPSMPVTETAVSIAFGVILLLGTTMTLASPDRDLTALESRLTTAMGFCIGFCAIALPVAKMWGQSRNRRSTYTYFRRETGAPAFALHDAIPSRDAVTEFRNRLEEEILRAQESAHHSGPFEPAPAELVKLARLFELGALTESEFALAKATLIER